MSDKESSDQDVRDWMVLAALATVFCCPPYGVAAVLAAHRARASLAEGDLDSARQASRDSRRQLLRSVVIGLVLYLLCFAILAWQISIVVTHWDEIKAILSANPTLGLLWPLAGISLWKPRVLRQNSPLVVLYGLIILATVDPTNNPLFPRCFVHEIAGLDCPGCGMLRALHELMSKRDVVGAIRLQPLIALAPIIAMAPVLRLRPALTSARVFGGRTALIVILCLAGYTIARNVVGSVCQHMQ
jgi:uncharacterized membrane protein